MPFRERHIVHFKTLASIRTPRIMIVIAMILAVAVGGAITFLTFTPWVQTTAGAGIVTAIDPNDRAQEINALVSGRIDEWFVRDGDQVREGDPIVRIIDNDPQLLDRLAAERDQLLAQRDAASIALETAQIDLNRTRGLFEDGLAARRDVEQAQIRIEDLRARVAAAEAALQRQETDISRLSAQLVAAPRAGTILRVNAGNSATFVSAGEILASFQPADAERAIELFIDGRDVALVTPGAPVRLQFEGWPAVQFSGWPSVAVGTFAGRVITVDPSAQPNGQFRVLVAEDPEAEQPWPDGHFVRFGANVRGWVLLDTVPLGYELWRQLNNFPPRLPQGNGPQASTGGASQG